MLITRTRDGSSCDPLITIFCLVSLPPLTETSTTDGAAGRSAHAGGDDGRRVRRWTSNDITIDGHSGGGTRLPRFLSLGSRGPYLKIPECGAQIWCGVVSQEAEHAIAMVAHLVRAEVAPPAGPPPPVEPMERTMSHLTGSKRLRVSLAPQQLVEEAATETSSGVETVVGSGGHHLSLTQ